MKPPARDGDLPALIADIGATHSRIAIVEKTGWRTEVFATDEYDKVEDLLDAAAQRLQYSQVRACCFAVAGPLVRNSVTITNGRLQFDAAQLSEMLGCPARLVNDFFALATAIPEFTELLQLGGSRQGDDLSSRHFVKAIVGPGSGLGMAILVPSRDRWRVLPSEGGHADLAPGNALEQEILSLLQRRLTNVSWESVLSGPGLVNLYEVVCQLWGSEPNAATPEWISAQGVMADDPICHQTLEIFFGLLGSAAGNLALTVCARGGVYLGGGIVPALKDFLVSSPFRRRFDERCELQEFIQDIPVFVILDSNPGLIGALACLDGPLAEEVHPGL
jgi:glucokinase